MIKQASRKAMIRIVRPAIDALCRGEYDRFQKSLCEPRLAQQKLLSELLKAQAQTEYGRSLKITGAENDFEFRNRVPVCDFDMTSLQSWVEKQKQRPADPVLTPNGIKHFEKTSGSSGVRKLIPYNQKLLGSFDRYFRIWLFDILKNGPKLDTLRVFISISPSLPSTEDSENKIGLADDSEYVSPILRLCLKLFLSVPLSLKLTKDPIQFLDQLVAHLAADSELEVVSIWHPSFFLVTWNHLLAHREKIAGQIESRNKMAAETLRAKKELRPKDLWPKLKLISAWDAANSRLPAQELKRLFPETLFQGKGLLATEAPMTLPLMAVGAVPFVTDVLFEFVDDDGEFFWIDELKDGGEYSLVISQRGGLLRYRIKDRVRVELNASSPTPCLEFIGRTQDSSDLVGEKITSGYLAKYDQTFVAESGCPFYVFLPHESEPEGGAWHRPNYIALVESPTSGARVSESALSVWWEERLVQSHHYAFARQIGQLGRVQVVQVPQLQSRLLQFYSQAKGIKSGDVKLRTLLTDPRESRQILLDLKITPTEVSL